MNLFIKIDVAFACIRYTSIMMPIFLNINNSENKKKRLNLKNVVKFGKNEYLSWGKINYKNREVWKLINFRRQG